MCRVVPKEQFQSRAWPVAGDAQFFKRMCASIDVSFCPLGNTHVCAQVLTSGLLSAQSLYVATDATLQQVSGPELCANGGLGVVVTDGNHYFLVA